MKVKELTEELQKCNPDAEVYMNGDGDWVKLVEVDKGNPSSCVQDVYLFGV